MRLLSPPILLLLGAGHLAAAQEFPARAGDIGGRGQKPMKGGNDNEEGRGHGRASSPFTDEYRRHVEGLLEEWHVPGVAIGVVDGEDIWTEGYGLAILPSTPVTPQTLFYCASTSKAFTAAILAIMIASGNYTTPSGLPSPASPLAWDTPLASIIPDDFVLADAWATSHITLEDALSHRTGVPRHDRAGSHTLRGGAADNGTRVATVRDGTRLLRHLPANAAPRTRWQYCNHMFVAASHAVQTLAGGARLGDLLREWIWAPLGMGATVFSLEDALAAGGAHPLAAGYGWDRHEGRFGAAVPFMPTDEIGGAGAVISSVEDYTRWIRMLLREDDPLPREGHRAVRTPRMMVSPEGWAAEEGAGGTSPPYDAPVAYALGWETSSYRGHRFWTHSGGMHAYGAEVFFYPDLDLGMVVLGNTAITSNGLARKLIWDMVDDRLGVPAVESMKSYQEDLEAAIDTAIDRYYPDRPARPIPPSVPLGAYEGTYFHPGYLNFTLQPASAHEDLITRDNTSLVAVRADATWCTVNEFQHVSGEYWMNFEHLRDNPHGAPLSGYAPVQFEVGPDGRVGRMGITWVQASPRGQDVVEGLVWFDKIE